MRNKLWWHQVVLIAALVGLTGWRILWGTWSPSLYLLWWWLGGVLGFLFVFADRFINVVVTNPDTVLSVKVKELVKKKNLLSGLKTLLIERVDQEKLTMRSGLFVVVWIFLGFWGLLLVANPVGRGFLAGLGLHLMFDLGWDYLNKERGVEHWFWQIKRKLSVKEIRGFVWVSLALSWVIITGL